MGNRSNVFKKFTLVIMAMILIFSYVPLADATGGHYVKPLSKIAKNYKALSKEYTKLVKYYNEALEENYYSGKIKSENKALKEEIKLLNKTIITLESGETATKPSKEFTKPKFPTVNNLDYDYNQIFKFSNSSSVKDIPLIEKASKLAVASWKDFMSGTKSELAFEKFFYSMDIELFVDNSTVKEGTLLNSSYSNGRKSQIYVLPPSEHKNKEYYNDIYFMRNITHEFVHSFSEAVRADFTTYNNTPWKLYDSKSGTPSWFNQGIADMIGNTYANKEYKSILKDYINEGESIRIKSSDLIIPDDYTDGSVFVTFLYQYYGKDKMVKLMTDADSNTFYTSFYKVYPSNTQLKTDFDYWMDNIKKYYNL